MLVFWPKIHATINVDKSNAISKEKLCIEIEAAQILTIRKLKEGNSREV